MTDAPKYETVSVFLRAEAEKKGPIYTHQYLRDDHRDLQRAAHDLCSTLRLFDASLSRETAVCVSILETMLEFFDPTEE